MSISMHTVLVPLELTPFIGKVIFIKGTADTQHIQEITPSPYCYLSYSRGKRPKISLSTKTIEHPIEFTGPKLSNAITVHYTGAFEQVLIEFTLFGLYELLGFSPHFMVNRTVGVDELPINRISMRLKQFVFDDTLPLENLAAVLMESLIECKQNRSTVPLSLRRSQKVILGHTDHPNLPKQQDFPTGMRNLNRLFLRYTGISPKQYHLLVKLHLATKSFMQEVAVTDIAFRCGFYDLSHFYKFFVKHTLHTPAQFGQLIDGMPVKRYYFSQD